MWTSNRCFWERKKTSHYHKVIILDLDLNSYLAKKNKKSREVLHVFRRVGLAVELLVRVKAADDARIFSIRYHLMF